VILEVHIKGKEKVYWTERWTESHRVGKWTVTRTRTI